MTGAAVRLDLKRRCRGVAKPQIAAITRVFPYQLLLNYLS